MKKSIFALVVALTGQSAAMPLQTGTIVPDRIIFSEADASKGAPIAPEDLTLRDVRDFPGEVLLLVYHSST